MVKDVVVLLKSGLEVTFITEELVLEKTTVDVSALVSQDHLPLLLHFTHIQLISTLHLSKVPDCVVIHLKDDFTPKSATFCLNRNVGDFSVQSQTKYVLLLPFPLPFALEDVSAFKQNNHQ
jgi:hypothetical protein